jgi:hypothetical protein
MATLCERDFHYDSFVVIARLVRAIQFSGLAAAMDAEKWMPRMKRGMTRKDW